MASQSQYGTINIRGKEFAVVQSWILMPGETEPKLGIVMNTLTFQCPMESRSDWGDVERCAVWLEVVLEFVPSAWLCPACGGLMILDSQFESYNYARANFTFGVSNDLALFCYFSDKIRRADQMRFLNWLKERVKGQDILTATIFNSEGQAWLNQTVGAGRMTVLPQFVSLDQLKLAQEPASTHKYRSADEALTLFQRGNQLLANRQVEEAIQVYEQIVQNYSGVLASQQLGTVLTALGNAYLQINSRSQALSAFEQATQILPDAVPAWHGVGWCHYLNKNLDSAIMAFERTWRLDPTFWLARYFLAESLYWADRYSKAAELLYDFIEEMRKGTLRDNVGRECYPHPRPYTVLAACEDF